MNNKIRIALIVSAIIIVLVAGVVWFAIPETATPPADVPVTASPVTNEEPQATHFSEPELREIVNKISKERFGDDAFVIFLSTEGPSQVEIEGVKRTVYIYAADSASAREESGKVRGLYHVDADTGEVFDNGSGSMEKVIIGE